MSEKKATRFLLNLAFEALWQRLYSSAWRGVGSGGARWRSGGSDALISMTLTQHTKCHILHLRTCGGQEHGDGKVKDLSLVSDESTGSVPSLLAMRCPVLRSCMLPPVVAPFLQAGTLSPNALDMRCPVLTRVPIPISLCYICTDTAAAIRWPVPTQQPLYDVQY
eukprot:377874-Rhodomonas_salina.4